MVTSDYTTFSQTLELTGVKQEYQPLHSDTTLPITCYDSKVCEYVNT